MDTAAVQARVKAAIKSCIEVERRAAQTLEWGEQVSASLLEIALDHLTLGRAGLYRAILEGGSFANQKSEYHSQVEAAVAGLRRAGQQQYVPLGLLTRAWLRYLEKDADGVRADLDEAFEIAERGPMPLYMADIHLDRARLFRDTAELKKARAMIEQCGYGRRNEELEAAEEAGKSWS